MLDLTTYRELERKLAFALGWKRTSVSMSGVEAWINPIGFIDHPPRWTNEDSLVFDLMHQHKIWVWQNPGEKDYMAEYMVDGVKQYHLEYGGDHHTSKIAMRCAILNAIVKQLTKEKM